MKVKELIEELKLVDGELPVAILDADEGSTLLNIIEIGDEGTHVALAGYYNDRFEPGLESDET